MRDYYHHYTVDAHSFMAIENIHRLRSPEREWERPFANLFTEIEEPELLFLSLLFHDVGKGMACEDHVAGSLQAIERVFTRLALKPDQADTVRFLIRDHLAMSASLLRRDIFDPETIRAFAEQVGTPERLKLLCLFTYADIRAVNPEALTPWKAESLWQLLCFDGQLLSRSLDEERFHANAEPADLQFVDRIFPLLAQGASREELASFLEGLPRRYLFAHSAEEIAAHFEMARRVEGKRRATAPRTSRPDSMRSHCWRRTGRSSSPGSAGRWLPGEWTYGRRRRLPTPPAWWWIRSISPIRTKRWS